MDAQVQEVTSMALSMPDQAKVILVRDDTSYQRAGEFIVAIKGLRKKIKETFMPIKQKIDAAKKEVLDQEKAADAPLLIAEQYLAPQLVSWERQKEQARRDEEFRLREEARKADENRRLTEAIALGEAGLAEDAETVLDNPGYVPPIVLPPSTPKVQGMSFRENWKFRITDPNLVPRQFLSVDEVKIGAVVRAMKGEFRAPGIEVYVEETVAARRVA